MENIKQRKIINSGDHTINDFPVGLNTIFKYLSGEDLLNCLLVSKVFNSEIITNNKCMDKIVFNTVDKELSIANQVLKRSRRKYQHLRIKSVIGYKINFRTKKFHWKSIDFQQTYVGPYVTKFLKKFTKTVKKISFSNCRVINGRETNSIPFFDKLETLEVSGDIAFECAKIVCKFRRQLETLKNLKIPQKAFGILTNIILQWNLKLEKLHLTDPVVTNITDTIESLRTQKNSLKELTMEILDQISMSFFWEELICLEKLTLGADYPEFYGIYRELKINKTIKSIRFNSEDLPLHVYQSISISTPNLSKICLSSTKPKLCKKSSSQEYSGSELREMFKSIKLINPYNRKR
ncbi:unnamed protein product [Diamesa hyperborea]